MSGRRWGSQRGERPTAREGEREREWKAERQSEKLMAVFCFGISERSIRSLVICDSFPSNSHIIATRHEYGNALIVYENWTGLLNHTTIFQWYICESDGWWQIDSIILQCFPLRRIASEITLLCLIHHYYVLTADPASDKYHYCDQYCNYHFL